MRNQENRFFSLSRVREIKKIDSFHCRMHATVKRINFSRVALARNQEKRFFFPSRVRDTKKIDSFHCRMLATLKRIVFSFVALTRKFPDPFFMLSQSRDDKNNQFLSLRACEITVETIRHNIASAKFISKTFFFQLTTFLKIKKDENFINSF
jgi:hypothetical protein